MSKSKREILYVFLAALAVRGLLFPFSTNLPGDADTRMLGALQWVRHPYWFHDVVWLPVHSYLIGAMFILTRNILFAGRFVSLMFGSLAVIPFAVFARKYLGRRAWVLACIFFIFFGLQIRLSLISLAEAVTNFFLFSCLALLFAVADGRQPSYSRVSLAGLCLLLANLNRQDTWMVLPVILAAAWWLYGLRKVLVFAAINSLILAYFAVSQIVYHESIFKLPQVYAHFGALAQSDPATNIARWLWYLAASLSPFVALFGAAGYLYAIRHKRMVLPAVLLVPPLAYELYFRCIKATIGQPRYLLMIGSLLILFAAYYFDLALTRLTPRWRTALVAVTVLAAAMVYSYTTVKKPYHLGVVPRQPSYALKLSDYLKRNVGLGGRFVIEDVEYLGPGVLARYSPDGRRISAGQMLPAADEVTGRVPYEEVRRRISRVDPNVLVLASGGDLRAHLLRKNPGRFAFVTEIGPYSIYRVSGDEPIR